MEKKEIKDVMETIDVLKMFAERGKQELRGFAIYMIVFGFYIAFNVIFNLTTKKYSLWFGTLPLAFFFSTIHVAGFLLPFILWLVVALGFYLSLYLFKLSFLLSILILLVLSVIVFNFIYGYAYRKSGEKTQVRYPIVSKIGTLWGIIMAGMTIFYVISAYILGWENIGPLSTLYWGYATGVGFFISGLIAPFFYILGILEFILVPFIALKSLIFSYAVFGLIGLLMGIYGIVLWKNRGD